MLEVLVPLAVVPVSVGVCEDALTVAHAHLPLPLELAAVRVRHDAVAVPLAPCKLSLILCPRQRVGNRDTVTHHQAPRRRHCTARERQGAEVVMKLDGRPE